MSNAQFLKMLDLSTGHLPEDLMTNEDMWLTDVIATKREHGALLHVPEVPHEFEAPEEITRIWVYARDLDCDYVLFDADGARNDDLPYWDW